MREEVPQFSGRAAGRHRWQPARRQAAQLQLFSVQLLTHHHGTSFPPVSPQDPLPHHRRRARQRDQQSSGVPGSSCQERSASGRAAKRAAGLRGAGSQAQILPHLAAQTALDWQVVGLRSAEHAACGFNSLGRAVGGPKGLSPLPR